MSHAGRPTVPRTPPLPSVDATRPPTNDCTKFYSTPFRVWVTLLSGCAQATSWAPLLMKLPRLLYLPQSASNSTD